MTGNVAEISGDSPMALYRLYAEDGTLLYIGITHSLSVRFSQHAEDKPWWPQVKRKTVEWFSDRASVLIAEARAIEDEQPVHNVIRPLRERERGTADRHRFPPLYFRPSGDDREWLATHVAETGRPQGRLLAEALSAYRAAHASDAQTAAQAVRPQRATRKPAAKTDRPAKCAHRFVLKGWCKDCREYVGQKSPGRQVKA